MTFPQRLADARVAKGLTRAQLAEACDVSIDAVNAWETGARLPSLSARHKLKEALPLLGDIPAPRRREPALRGRMESTTVYLRPDQTAALRELANMEGCAVAELIREAVDLLLQVDEQ